MTEPGPRWEPQSPPRAENAANFFRSSARAARWSSAVVSTPRVHWRAILGIGRGIANARARSVAAPIANREPQKSSGGGQKCGQLFSVEPKAEIEVARYEVRPDGTVVIVTGKPAPVEPDNPWPLDEFRTKETK